jgi:predicted XRE-type DNA-binding protein
LRESLDLSFAATLESMATVAERRAECSHPAGSGNVFADLNLPEADDLLAKAELAAKIIAEIQRRRLTQSQAATILGIDQPKVSALKQGRLSGFSIERPMRLLLVLGRDIEITVKGRTRSKSPARLHVA